MEKEVDASGVEPKASYLKARMALAGTCYRCWNIICNYLHDLPAADFADGKMNRCLDALENAGDTGSREPGMLSELYRTKGLSNRADKIPPRCPPIPPPIGWERRGNSRRTRIVPRRFVEQRRVPGRNACFKKNRRLILLIIPLLPSPFSFCILPFAFTVPSHG